MDALWRNIRLIGLLLDRLSLYREEELENLDDMETLVQAIKKETDSALEQISNYKLLNLNRRK